MRIEEYLRLVGVINTEMWAKAGPLEKELRELQASYDNLSGRPITDVFARGSLAIIAPKLDETAKKLNAIYDQWRMRIALLGRMPEVPKSAGDWSSQIPWPAFVPLDVRRQIVRFIRQGGLPLANRVTLVPTRIPGGGQGVAIEFSKW